MSTFKSQGQVGDPRAVGILGDGTWARLLAARFAREGYQGARFDADNTLFLERELLGMEETIYETARPPRNADRWIPSMAMPGREFVRETSYRQKDSTLKMAPYEGAGDDVPRASKKIGEKKHDVVGYHGGCFWTFDEIGAAQMLGMNLDSEGMEDVMLSWDTLRNFLAWYGDKNLKLSGLLSLENTGLKQAQNQDGDALPFNDNSDALEIYAFCCDTIDAVADGTSDTFFADTFLLASTAYRYIECKQITGRDRTILEQLRISRPGVDIAPVRELQNVDTLSRQVTVGSVANIVTPTAPSDDWCVAYNRDQRVLHQMVPMPLRFDPELYQSSPSEWGRIGRGRIGSIHNPYPGAIQLRYGI